MWFLFGYCSVCQQSSSSAKKMNLISFSLFSLWNHSLIIDWLNTVWAKADSPNSRSYTVFTEKATYHHPGSVCTLKYVQPNLKIQFPLFVCCSPAPTYFLIPAKLKLHTALESHSGWSMLYFLSKRNPIWVWHLHLPALLALARRIQWVSSQPCAAASLEESAPTEGFQRRSKVTRHYNNTARRMFSQLVGEVLFVSHPWNINQRVPSETRFNKLCFLSSPLTYLRVN